ncbi:MAG: hypothetical protein ABIM49_02335 [candidate division WOR-3 bacterium]
MAELKGAILPEEELAGGQIEKVETLSDGSLGVVIRGRSGEKVYRVRLPYKKVGRALVPTKPTPTTPQVIKDTIGVRVPPAEAEELLKTLRDIHRTPIYDSVYIRDLVNKNSATFFMKGIGDGKSELLVNFTKTGILQDMYILGVLISVDPPFFTSLSEFKYLMQVLGNGFCKLKLGQTTEYPAIQLEIITNRNINASVSAVSSTSDLVLGTFNNQILSLKGFFPFKPIIKIDKDTELRFDITWGHNISNYDLPPENFIYQNAKLMVIWDCILKIKIR